MKPTIKHVPGPAEHRKKPQPQPQASDIIDRIVPAIDMLRLNLTFAKLLESLVEEVVHATPSHAWRNLPKIKEDVTQLRTELEELVGARNKKRRR